MVMTETTKVEQTWKGDPREVWPGRYFVTLIAKEAFGYKDVDFTLWQADMDEEADKLLSELGWSPNNDYPYGYLVSQVQETFTEKQVNEIKEYFAKEWDPTPTIEVNPARIPAEGFMGAAAIPFGGLQDNYLFFEHTDYPLDFKVIGYHDLRHCEPTPETKLKDITNQIRPRVNDDPKLLFELIEELQNWFNEKGYTA
jgi:hypothetical protein